MEVLVKCNHINLSHKLQDAHLIQHHIHRDSPQQLPTTIFPNLLSCHQPKQFVRTSTVHHLASRLYYRDRSSGCCWNQVPPQLAATKASKISHRYCRFRDCPRQSTISGTINQKDQTTTSDIHPFETRSSTSGRTTESWSLIQRLKSAKSPGFQKHVVQTLEITLHYLHHNFDRRSSHRFRVEIDAS